MKSSSFLLAGAVTLLIQLISVGEAQASFCNCEADGVTLFKNDRRSDSELSWEEKITRKSRDAYNSLYNAQYNKAKQLFDEAAAIAAKESRKDGFIEEDCLLVKSAFLGIFAGSYANSASLLELLATPKNQFTAEVARDGLVALAFLSADAKKTSAHAQRQMKRISKGLFLTMFATNVAHGLAQQGHHSEARRIIDLTSVLETKIAHPVGFRFLSLAQICYNYLDDKESAVKYACKALSLDKARFGNASPEVIRDLKFLAQIHARTGDLAEASYYLKKAKLKARKHPDELHLIEVAQGELDRGRDRFVTAVVNPRNEYTSLLSDYGEQNCGVVVKERNSSPFSVFYPAKI